MAQQQNNGKAQSQHKPSIVRFKLPKRHKSGWLQWLHDYLETQTDQNVLEATYDSKRFRAMYDQFQTLVYPKTKNLYKLDLSRTELNLLYNKDCIGRILSSMTLYYHKMAFKKGSILGRASVHGVLRGNSTIRCMADMAIQNVCWRGDKGVT